MNNDIIISIINGTANSLIICLIGGFFITKQIEKIKLKEIKEKEFNFIWAEKFLKIATDFNDNVTSCICLAYYQMHIKDENLKKKYRNNRIEKMYIISELDWNIKNYISFSETYKKDVLKFQDQIMNELKDFDNKKIDLEGFRNVLFEYNKAVKNAHKEMIKME